MAFSNEGPAIHRDAGSGAASVIPRAGRSHRKGDTLGINAFRDGLFDGWARRPVFDGRVVAAAPVLEDYRHVPVRTASQVSQQTDIDWSALTAMTKSMQEEINDRIFQQVMAIINSHPPELTAARKKIDDIIALSGEMEPGAFIVALARAKTEEQEVSSRKWMGLDPAKEALDQGLVALKTRDDTISKYMTVSWTASPLVPRNTTIVTLGA